MMNRVSANPQKSLCKQNGVTFWQPGFAENAVPCLEPCSVMHSEGLPASEETSDDLYYPLLLCSISSNTWHFR